MVVRSSRTWTRRLAALAVGSCLALLAAEFGVRLVLGEQPKFPRHVVRAPWGLRRNAPNAVYRHASADVDVEFRINSRGLRDDREHAYAKPDGLRRIVCLGDSFTIGYEVDEADCFARVLERELRASGLRVDVLNAGVSGFSTAEEVLYLERELARYEPDLVILSFFGNDLADNVRTGLFALHEGRLEPAADEYVPAGRLGDFLNTNVVFNWLSEHSDAFVVLKERLTKEVKRDMVESERTARTPALDPATHERRLCAALYERLYAWTRSHEIPLVVQSIPFPDDADEKVLVDSFPLEDFDVDREGLVFVPARTVLQPLTGKELLYWRRSHAHWTPRAHEASGRELARVVLDANWLR
ncbi:MAG: hypothetical protein IPJ77_05595 [Planctomycetes bacterium]|nr:hypothetical protein [Planctomycetota bacterium]